MGVKGSQSDLVRFDAWLKPREDGGVQKIFQSLGTRWPGDCGHSIPQLQQLSEVLCTVLQRAWQTCGAHGALVHILGMQSSWKHRTPPGSTWDLPRPYYLWVCSGEALLTLLWAGGFLWLLSPGYSPPHMAGWDSTHMYFTTANIPRFANLLSPTSTLIKMAVCTGQQESGLEIS